MKEKRTGRKGGKSPAKKVVQGNDGPKDLAEDLRSYYASRLVFTLLEARPCPRNFTEADRDVRDAIRRVARAMDEVPSECLEKLILECPIHAHYLKSASRAAQRKRAGSSRRPPEIHPEPPSQRLRSEAAYLCFLETWRSKRKRNRLYGDYNRLLARLHATSILQMPEELDDYAIRRPKKSPRARVNSQRAKR